MASTLFFEVAHRAAFDFDEEDFVFDDGLLALDDFDVPFALADFAFVLLCFDRDALFAFEFLPRVRAVGASFTGSATVRVRPGAIAFDER